MLSQHKKTIQITITSFVIASAILGGAVSAEQRVINGQTVVNGQRVINGQTAVSAEQTVISTERNRFNNDQFQFPPANALEQISQRRAPSANQGSRPVMNTQPGRPAQNYPMPYPSQRGMNPNRPPNYAARGPYGPRPQPYAQGPYGNPYNQGPYGNPYNRGPYNNNNGPFGGSPFKNFGGGPFNNNSAPWETWPLGGRDSFWSRKELPFKNQNPTDWFKPGDPKEGMAVMWDDLIAAPDDLGTMPGGWHVPAVSVPNPVDLEDQLEKASKEIPDLIRVYND